MVLNEHDNNFHPQANREQKRGRHEVKRLRRRWLRYLMLSLCEVDGDKATSFESTTGLTTPSMRFLLQSPIGPTGDSLLWVRLPVRSSRSSRARLLLTPLCWVSLTGENSGIEISSSLDAGLELKS